MSVCVLVFGRHSMLAAAFAFVLLTLFVYVYACNACVRVLDTIRKKQVHTHTHTHTHHLLYIASNCTHACEWELSPDGSSKFLGVSILQGECLSTTNPPPPWSARRRKPILRSRSRTWARKIDDFDKLEVFFEERLSFLFIGLAPWMTSQLCFSFAWLERLECQEKQYKL
jgi:hypothetical protein